MATYKVWLTVKDSYGNTKEVDGGNININLTEMSTADVDQVVKQLDPYFTTETEVERVVDNNDTLRYSSFDLKSEQ